MVNPGGCRRDSKEGKERNELSCRRTSDQTFKKESSSLSRNVKRKKNKAPTDGKGRRGREVVKGNVKSALDAGNTACLLAISGDGL